MSTLLPARARRRTAAAASGRIARPGPDRLQRRRHPGAARPPPPPPSGAVADTCACSGTIDVLMHAHEPMENGLRAVAAAFDSETPRRA